MKVRFALVVILALLLPLATAQFTEDFSVSAEDTLFTLQGTPADSHFLITNTGNVASGYSISVVSSEASAWVAMGPLAFALDPGQSQVVLIHLDIPRDVKPGTYELETVFTTTFGTVEVIEQDVRVDVPLNLEMQSVPERTIGPCGIASFPITIINPGAFAEEYSFIVSRNIAGFANFTRDSLALAAGQNQTITLTLAPQDCTRSGTIDFTVTGTAASTKVEAELDLALAIENTFVPEIKLRDRRVNTDENTVNGTLTNTGSERATYALGIEGADFVTVSPRSVTLEPGASATFTITSRPLPETDQQAYPLTLTATVERIEYAKDFTLTVRNPNWFERNLWLLFRIALAAIIIVVAALAISKWAAYAQTPEYQARKEEKAKLKAERQAEREAERIREAEEKQRVEERKLKEAQREAERRQREQERLDAKLAKERSKGAKEAAAELKATHVLISREKLQGDATVSRRRLSWWVALLALLIIAGILAFGFRVQLLENIDAVIAGAIALVIIIALLIIYRVFFGTKKAEQEWVAMKPRRENALETGWRKGLGQLWFRINEIVPNVRIIVTGGRKSSAFVAPEADVYQYINIIPEGLAVDQIDKQRFMFRVSRTWLERRQVSEGNVKLMRYTADGWKGIGTEKLRSDDKWVYYQAQSVGFEPYAIVGKSRVERKQGIAPGWGFLALAIVLLALILGGAWYLATLGLQGTEQVPPTTEGIPPQTWPEDTRHTVDLGQYFNDPDGDPLHYSYTPVPNIVITISGDVATLTPEQDWTGTRTVVFTADDRKGGKVSSNEVTLTVIEAPEPTFWTNVRQGFETYAGYIVLGIILLVVLIVILEYRKSFKAR